jgi:hypothetical protein
MINQFLKLNFLDKLLITVSFSIVLFLFIQNFIFSSSFDYLIYRGVDDYAFHKSLRNYHEALLSFKLDKLFRMFDYGYGWIFWFIHTILTFPFYLISLSGSDTLLISSARNISLLFSIGSLFILYKIIYHYTKDNSLSLAASLIFMTFPYFAYSAMSFRTLAQVQFFCMLTFYLSLIYRVDNGNLKYIAYSLAAAIGTKLSAIFITPLLAMVVLNRYHWKFDRKTYHDFLYFLKYFIPSTIFFINPSWFLAPFHTSLFTKHIGYINLVSSNVTTNIGFNQSFFDNFFSAYSDSYLSVYILILFFIGLFIKFVKDFIANEELKYDFLYIFLFVGLLSTFLASYVKLNYTYITNYFYSFSFLLLLAIVLLKDFKKPIKIVIALLLIVLNTYYNFHPIKKWYFYHHDRANSDMIVNRIKTHKELAGIIGSPNQQLSILADYRAPFVYSNFRKNIYLGVIFDNISVILNEAKNQQRTIDYIVLSKESRLLLNDLEFKENISNTDDDVKNQLILEKAVMDKLIKEGLFDNKLYDRVYEKNNIIMYKLMNKSS